VRFEGTKGRERETQSRVVAAKDSRIWSLFPQRSWRRPQSRRPVRQRAIASSCSRSGCRPATTGGRDPIKPVNRGFCTSHSSDGPRRPQRPVQGLHRWFWIGGGGGWWSYKQLYSPRRGPATAGAHPPAHISAYILQTPRYSTSLPSSTVWLPLGLCGARRALLTPRPCSTACLSLGTRLDSTVLCRGAAAARDAFSRPAALPPPRARPRPARGPLVAMLSTVRKCAHEHERGRDHLCRPGLRLVHLRSGLPSLPHLRTEQHIRRPAVEYVGPAGCSVQCSICSVLVLVRVRQQYRRDGPVFNNVRGFRPGS
jgi:hypothetical protein